MSQFRPRSLARFAPRFRRSENAFVSIRVRMAIALPCKGDPSRALRPLMQAAASAALALLGLTGSARAQTTSVPHDITLRFQTPDVINPNNSALQSIWSANDKAGWTVGYDLAKSWKADSTFGSFKRLKTPKINMKFFTIPSIDLGEWGGGGRAFTKGNNTGLRFSATATGGNVSVDYPVRVHLDTPKYLKPGDIFYVHATYQGDATARVKTFSPQAYASVKLMGDIQVYLNARVETGSKDVFNGDIIDWCNRDDPESPKYGKGGNNKGLKFEVELFNTNNLLKYGVNKFATFEYPGKGRPATVAAALSLPVVNTVGQPGSSINYNSGAGGTTKTTSYEYTMGITIPDAVSKNPNATYARGEDAVLTLTADFTNLLTNGLEDAGIPCPPLNYNFNLGPLDVSTGLLDLKAEVATQLLQEFGFVPKPKIRLQIGNSGAVTGEYEIDPINGVDIPVQMPALPNGADPNASVSIKLVPVISMSNNFISNTYLDFKGGLSFRPVYIEGSSSFGNFKYAPVDLGVSLDVPCPIYKTQFEIPFDAKTGDAFYVTTQSPPLASLLSLDHSLLYVNENEASDGGIGVSASQMALTADPKIVSPNDFAGIWFGTVNSSPGSATGVTYNTQAYWDSVVSASLMFIQDVNKGRTQATWDLRLVNKQDDSSGYSMAPVDLTPGMHHIYASNTAKTPGSAFGPLVTTLPVSVAYPKPRLDTLGVRCPLFTTGKSMEFFSSHYLIYKPLDAFRSSGGTGKTASSTAYGPIPAGSDGFTLIAIDHQPFNDPNAPNDPRMVAPNSVGSFSRIKLDGKLLSPDPDGVYNNTDTAGSKAYPFTSGMIPTSMLSKAGNHTVQVTNPTSGGKGGDSNTFIVQVLNPIPVVDETCAVYQNPVQGANTDLYSHDITAGNPDTRIRITGSGLLADTKVYWHDTAHPLTTVFINSHQMYATLPAAYITQPQSDHTLMVVNPNSGVSAQPDGGTSLTYKLNVNTANPSIKGVEVDGDSINALTCSTPDDTTLTIRGEHFWPGVTAWWNDQALAVKFVDEHTLTATVPVSLLKKIGPASVKISSKDFNGHTETSSAFNMSVVYAHPVLVSLNELPAGMPASIPPSMQPTTITVTGGLFCPNATLVKIGGQFAQTTVVDATHLNAVVPPAIAGAVGNYDVVVVNPVSRAADGASPGDGGASNPISLKIQGVPQPIQIGMSATLTRLNSSTVQAQVTLTNIGVPVTSLAMLKYATLDGRLTSSTLPYTLGKMDTGATRTLTLQFPCPAPPTSIFGNPVRTGGLVLAGDMTGGTFNCAATLRIP